MADFNFTDGRITESSGLAHSGVEPNGLITQNDENTKPQTFRVDKTTGDTIATWSYGTATIDDPEAVSRDVLNRFWYADCGDNNEDRPYFRLLMTPEPTGTGALGDVPYTRYLMKWPDGSHNCETLLTHNEAFGRYFITKDSTSRLYKAPPLDSDPSHYNTLIKMAPTFGPYVSDGAVTPDGLWLATLRKDVLDKAYIYSIADNWAFEQTVNLADHGQTKIEGITFDPDQMAFWVSSEGSHAPCFSTATPSDFLPGDSPAPVPVTCP